MSRSIEAPPSLPEHSFSNSKKGVYAGNSSRAFMDSDMITPLSTQNSSNSMKQKEVIWHDVIDIDSDDDDDSADILLVGEKVGKSDKGKTVEAIHDDHGDHQFMEFFEFCPPVMENFGPGIGLESSNGCTSVSNNLINVDGHGSDRSYDDDDYSDLISDDYMVVDDYSLLQAHFDTVNIPPGIEAPLPWLAQFDLGSKKHASTSFHTWYQTQSNAKNSHGTDLSQPSWSLDPSNHETQGPSAGSSSLQNKMDASDHPSGIASSPPLFSQTAPCKKKSDASHRRRRKLKWALDYEANSTNHGFVNYPKTKKLPHGGELPYWGQLESAKKVAGSSSFYHSHFIGSVDGSLHPSETQISNPWGWKSPHFCPLADYTANSSFVNPYVSLHAPPEQPFNKNWVHNSAGEGNNAMTADSTDVTISDEARNEILRKFQNIKQFDTVEDTSDHCFVHLNSSMKQHSKHWAKRIQEEWKLLEKDLPDSILVRVYESRIDLLRAVIIGAEGTPYHDGLFFFDVCFPCGYPNEPPLVHYHSCGLRLNPNLYNGGKVCLSLLNTWSGGKNEKWLPGVSTILQVLVSIQGLILNAKPYFNEPGYARLSGSASGEIKSLQYNEDTFILSLRTMMYLMRRPPKNFEDFVAGHFCSRAHDILVACKAYMDGAQVGCLVKGGVQDVDQGDKSCSKEFKISLAAYMSILVGEFTKIGAKDCDKFMSPSTVEANKLLGELPEAAAAATTFP